MSARDSTFTSTSTFTFTSAAAATSCGQAAVPPPTTTPNPYFNLQQQQLAHTLHALRLFETNELRVLQTLLSEFQRLPTKFTSRAFKLSDALLHMDSDIESFYNLKSQLGTVLILYYQQIFLIRAI